MKLWEKELQECMFSFDNETVVVQTKNTRKIVKIAIQEIIEQIEDCKFSQLGDLIEKLKEEYK